MDSKELKIRLITTVVLGCLLVSTMLGIIYVTLQRRSGVVIPSALQKEEAETEVQALNRLVSLGNTLQAEVRQVDDELSAYRSALKNQNPFVYRHYISTSTQDIEQLAVLTPELELNQSLLEIASSYSSLVMDINANSIRLATNQLYKDISTEGQLEIAKELGSLVQEFDEQHSEFIQTVLGLASSYSVTNQDDGEVQELVDNIYQLLINDEKFITSILAAKTPQQLELMSLKGLLDTSDYQLGQLQVEPDLELENKDLIQAYQLLLVDLTKLNADLHRVVELQESGKLEQERFYRLGDRILTAYNDSVSAYNKFSLQVEEYQSAMAEEQNYFRF